MKKIISMLLLMLLLSAAVSASAEGITAAGIGYQNVPFSNGYYGFCIDIMMDGAYVGDEFVAAESTTAAVSNKDNSDISQPLKVLFVHCFEEIFESDGNGGYRIKNDNVVMGVIYHFAEGQYIWGEQVTLANKVKSYTGDPIADNGTKIELDNGDVVTIDFMVLIPKNTEQQYFFSYKLDVKKPNENPTMYDVTVTTDGNGTVSTSAASGEEGTRITLTAVPEDGYRFKEWEVVSGDVTIENDSFVLGDEDVEIRAIFEKLPDPVYDVTVTTDGNGTAGAAPASGKTGTEILLIAVPEDGYRFKEWEVVSGDVTIENDSFVLGDEDVEIRAIFEKLPDPVYDVTVTTDGNGTAGAAPASGKTGTEILLIAVPEDGYRFKEWEVVSGDVTIENDSFVLGDEDVEIRAIFEEIPVIDPPSVVKQPEDQYVAEGQTAEFTVEAAGDELSYQWYIDRNDGEGWKKIPGAVDATYTTGVTDPDCDGFEYFCRIIDGHGNAVESDTAVLYVSPAPVLPETGDASTPMLWLAMCVLSLMGMVVLGKRTCAE